MSNAIDTTRTTHSADTTNHPQSPRVQACMPGRSARRSRHLMAISLAASALWLGACSGREDETVGEKLDQVVASTEAQAEAAKTEIQQGAKEATAAATQATEQLGDKVQSATSAMSAALDDAGITAAVKAELARDPGLSALDIRVDTEQREVSLTGKAPSAAAKERATRLALAVQGVQKVDNRLVVQG